MTNQYRLRAMPDDLRRIAENVFPVIFYSANGDEPIVANCLFDLIHIYNRCDRYWLNSFHIKHTLYYMKSHLYINGHQVAENEDATLFESNTSFHGYDEQDEMIFKKSVTWLWYAIDRKGRHFSPHDFMTIFAPYIRKKRKAWTRSRRNDRSKNAKHWKASEGIGLDRTPDYENQLTDHQRENCKHRKVNRYHYYYHITRNWKAFRKTRWKEIDS